MYFNNLKDFFLLKIKSFFSSLFQRNSFISRNTFLRSLKMRPWGYLLNNINNLIFKISLKILNKKSFLNAVITYCSYFFIILLLLSGCAFKQGISDKELRDKVMACASGFSDETQAGLHAGYVATTISGEVTGHYAVISKALIFSELPESDRLKGYEDYIKCLQAEKKQ